MTYGRICVWNFLAQDLNALIEMEGPLSPEQVKAFLAERQVTEPDVFAGWCATNLIAITDNVVVPVETDYLCSVVHELTTSERPLYGMPEIAAVVG